MTSSLDIRTKRLLITPFSKRHLTESYVGWLNDYELMRFSEQRHKAHNMESCYAYWQSFEGTSNYFWAIEEVEQNFGHIGNINAYVDKNNLLADIGILIGEKKAHKKRYGIEAWIGVCHFLFQKAGMRKITAGTISANLPMLKLARHVEMIEDGVRKMHYVYNNQEVDIIYMAFFKKQWDGLIASDESKVFKKYLQIDEL